MQPKSGKYSIQITEELWEAAYFDEVKLIAVDHPSDTDIFVDEQYIPPPFAEFKVYGVAEKAPSTRSQQLIIAVKMSPML